MALTHRTRAALSIACLFALGLLALAQERACGQGAPQSGTIIVDHFGGLNDTDASATLDNSEAQDALNVESSVSGTSLLKRKGYSRLASLTVTTSPVSGSFSFIDPNGNRQDIVCHDHYCAKSTNGSAFSVFVTSAGTFGSGTIPTRWSFVAINGKAYGANDSRDAIWQYDGTTLSWPGTMPKGAVLELTKDRLVVADVSANPNGVYYSQSGTYTNFTTGLNSADPYIDFVGAPGDRVTALKYALGKLFVFKATSITACILKDQYSSSCAPVSNVIGTNDPLSVVEIPGAITFRGAEGNYWGISADGTLTLLSKKISNFVKSQTSGSTQSNTQTSQADWQAGAQFPGGSWDTGTVAGAVFPSSSTHVDQSTTAFSLGIFDLSSMTLTGIVPSLFQNSGFENGQGASAPWGWTGSASNPSVLGGSRCGLNSTGNFTWGGTNVAARTGCGGTSYSMILSIVNSNNGAVLYSDTETFTATSGCAYHSINVSTQNVYMAISIQSTVDGSQGGSILSTSFSTAAVPGGLIEYGVGASFPLTGAGISCVIGQPNGVFIDFAQPYGTAKSTFTSAAFDTGFSTPTWGVFKATSTAIGPEASLSYATIVSATQNGVYDSPVSVNSDGRAASAQKRWAKYQVYFSTTKSSVTATVSNVELNYATTGLYQTQCITAGSNVSSWGLLSCDQTTAGGGSVVLYATSAYSCANLSTQTVTNWPTVTNNANLSISVSSAVLIGFRSLLTSSTDQAQVNACTLYWNNGVLAPPVWGTYDSIKNAVYWTASINNSATNNRVLKYDLNLFQWYPFGLNANAIRSIQNTTYFGDSTGGYWNQYGSVDTDNGSPINAYWKSKDFGASQPFLDKRFDHLSLVTKNQVTGNMTATYTTSNGGSGAYTISLATDSTKVYVHANANLPLLSPYQFINLKLGNNSITPFEVDGLGLDYYSFPWSPKNP